MGYPELLPQKFDKTGMQRGSYMGRGTTGYLSPQTGSP